MLTATLKPLLWLLFFLLLAVVVLAILKQRGLLGGPTGPWPFYVRKPLSQPEQVLYFRLVRALPDHIVLAQVQVSRVLGVKKGQSFHAWNNRINRLSYDFVVCAKDSSVVAAIELDDKTHDGDRRASTDAKKDKATQDAGLRLVRWHVKSLPDEAAIKQALLSAA